MSPDYERIDVGVVPYQPRRKAEIIEDIAAIATCGCLILTAVTNDLLWVAPTLPLLVVAMICQKVRSK